MASVPLSKELAQQALNEFYKNGKSLIKSSTALGIPNSTFRARLDSAKRYGLIPHKVYLSDPNVHKILNLERELSQLRAINSSLSQETSGLESIKEFIHKCTTPARPPNWTLLKGNNSSGTGIPTLQCSDWHYDEVVYANQINGVNAFNRTISQRRIKTLFYETVDILKNKVANPTYDKIVLLLGGDLLSGNIHEELRETNEVPLAKSLIAILDNLIAGIVLLLDHFKYVEVHGLPGNHGRMDKKPRYKNRVFDNFEWILLQFLMKHFKGEDRVHFNISDGADLRFNIYKTRYLMTHGDQFKGGSGISGVLAPLMLGDHRKRKRSMACDQPYDYLLMGHFHQMLFVKGIIVNGSLKGYDEYAFQNNFEFEVPTQNLWLTHPIYGITTRWPIYLEKPGVRF